MDEKIKQKAINNLQNLIDQQEEIIANANQIRMDYILQQIMLETGNKINRFKQSNTQ